MKAHKHFRKSPIKNIFIKTFSKKLLNFSKILKIRGL